MPRRGRRAACLRGVWRQAAQGRRKDSGEEGSSTARPTKSEIDYFPMDVHMDTRMKLIEAEFGLTGFAVVVKLLQYIYGQGGYYGEWNDEVALLFGQENRLGGGVVSEILSAAIRRGIFDRDLYERFSILTSAEIQENYLRAVARRALVEVEKDYLLIDYAKLSDNVHINGVSAYKNPGFCIQKSTKESRVNKSKEKERKGEGQPAAKPPPSSPQFRPPTIGEATEYARELGGKVDPQRFLDYYEANGWMMGRTPMKDWRAAMRRWNEAEGRAGGEAGRTLSGQAYRQREYSPKQLDGLAFDWSQLEEKV